MRNPIAHRQPIRGLTLCAALVTAFASAFSQAQLPAGASVAFGNAKIATVGNGMTVTNSPNAILNWQSFSIGQNSAVRFVQQSAASSVLNRVTGTDPSTILGSLSSNGRVFLINPNGILFGPGARIDVAGFVASALNLTDTDFLGGKLAFSGGTGALTNRGEIRTPAGGHVYLIGNAVTNEGVITSPGGEVILAAGNSATLLDTGTPNVTVSLKASDNHALNVGQIVAEGGSANIYGALVRNAGIVSASSVVNEGGRIVLRATRRVDLAETSQLTADGTKGGSIVAKVEDGGSIAGVLSARGTLSAQGDGSTGSGGFVETSAAKLDIQNVSVGTRGGQWLLDPNDITIQAAGSDTNVTGNPNFSSTNDGSIITTGTIQTALNAGTSVAISTAAAGANTEPGDITVADPISKTAGGDAALTLNAFRNINVNASITSTVGKLNMTFNPDTTSTGTGAVALGMVTLDANGGTISVPNRAVNIIGSTATINSAMSVGDLNISGGTLNANAPVTVSNSFAFSGGGWVSGALTLANTSTGSVSAGMFSDNLALQNNGALTISGAGSVGTIGTSTITNAGTLTLSGTDPTPIRSLGGSLTINNPGTLTDASATSKTLMGEFNNSGSVNVPPGNTFNLVFGGTETGAFNIAGATLGMDFGTFNLNAGTTIPVSGSLAIGGNGNNSVTANVPLSLSNLTMTGGSLNANAPVTVSNSFALSNGGWISGALNLSSTSTGSITSSVFMVDVTLQNSGALTIGGAGYVQTAGTSTITNAGTLTLSGTDPAPIRNGGSLTLNNAGALIENSPTNQTIYVSSFSNTGTISVLTGSLSIVVAGPNPTTTLIEPSLADSLQNTLVSSTSAIGKSSSTLQDKDAADKTATNVQAMAAMLAYRQEIKSSALAQAIETLRADPSAADLQLCSGADTDLCISRPTEIRHLPKAVPTNARLPTIEHKIAIVLGVSDYADPIPKLQTPDLDTEFVANMLAESFGYEVRALKNPTKADIVREMNRVIAEAGPNDSVVVYYAGHGYVLEETQTGYWIPADGTAKSPANWLSNRDITRMLGNVSARQILLVSDSCFSGKLTEEGSKAMLSADSDPAESVLMKRSVVAFSSGGDEPVADQGRDGHSIFAHHFLDALAQVRDVTTGRRLHDDVRTAVSREFPQQPQYSPITVAGHEAGGDFLVELRSGGHR